MNQKIRTIFNQLLEQYPTLKHLTIEIGNNTPTVGINKDTLYINPNYTDKLSDIILSNVILSMFKKHELLDDYKKAQHKTAFNVAADIAIGFEMERHGLKLPPDTMHNIYPQYKDKTMVDIYTDLVLNNQFTYEFEEVQFEEKESN